MKDNALRFAAKLGLVALAVTACVSLALAECLPWNSAGKVISQNGLVPGGAIYNKVKSKSGGKVISADLCQNNGRYVYKFKVLGKKGDVRTITVDAKTGNF